MTSYQPSITEWFAQIGECEESKKFRQEDNGKNERLETLYQTIGLNYERPDRFEAKDLNPENKIWQKILKQRGSELCAIRLVPKEPGLEKLRKRGLSIKECYFNWFVKQDINPADYYAELCPHSPVLIWSTTFVVHRGIIHGEIIKGLHVQLTHGDSQNQLYQFRYDFKNWQWNRKNQAAEHQIKKIIKSLLTANKARREKLKKLLKAEFNQSNYLMGYFEATVWPGNKIKFIDYNRLLPKHISIPPGIKSQKSFSKLMAQGVPAYPGIAKGRAVIVNEKNLNKIALPKKSILVCDNTDIRFLPLMKKASAIITDHGGTLSHAAIIARELKKPCVVNTGNSTKIFKTGDLLAVDAAAGTITKL